MQFLHIGWGYFFVPSLTGRTAGGEEPRSMLFSLSSGMLVGIKSTNGAENTIRSASACSSFMLLLFVFLLFSFRHVSQCNLIIIQNVICCLLFYVSMFLCFLSFFQPITVVVFSLFHLLIITIVTIILFFHIAYLSSDCNWCRSESEGLLWERCGLKVGKGHNNVNKTNITHTEVKWGYILTTRVSLMHIQSLSLRRYNSTVAYKRNSLPQPQLLFILF